MELFDVVANPRVDAIEKVPEDFRWMYVKDAGGAFVLHAEDEPVKRTIAVYSGLKQTLNTLRNEVTTYKKGKVDLTALKDYGETPEAIAAAVAEKINGLTEQIKGVNVKKIKEDLSQEWAPKVTAAEAKAAKREAQLQRNLLEGAANAALLSHEANDLLLPHVVKFLRTKEVGDSMVTVVVDEEGQERYSASTAMPMTVKDLVAQFKADAKYAPFFASKAPAGLGAGEQRRTSSMDNTGKMSAMQKISAGLDELKKR